MSKLLVLPLWAILTVVSFFLRLCTQRVMVTAATERTVDWIRRGLGAGATIGATFDILTVGLVGVPTIIGTILGALAGFLYGWRTEIQ